MNSSFIPGPLDENSRLQTSVTKVANYSGPALDMGIGQEGGIGVPVAGVIWPSAVDRTDGDETYTFVLEESDDAITWVPIGAASPSRTDATTLSIGGFLSGRYVRLTLTTGGTTPSITYQAWLVGLGALR